MEKLQLRLFSNFNNSVNFHKPIRDGARVVAHQRLFYGSRTDFPGKFLRIKKRYYRCSKTAGIASFSKNTGFAIVNDSRDATDIRRN